MSSELTSFLTYIVDALDRVREMKGIELMYGLGSKIL